MLLPKLESPYHTDLSTFITFHTHFVLCHVGTLVLSSESCVPKSGMHNLMGTEVDLSGRVEHRFCGREGNRINRLAATPA